METSLIIEDDIHIAELLSIHLKDLHLEPTIRSNGKDGLEEALKNTYSVILLDIMLPGMDGIDVCREIRSTNKTVPIIMLTAKTEEIDKVVGLETGADDYITKPFSIRELQARIKAVIRRSKKSHAPDVGAEHKLLEFGELRIDVDKRAVWKDDERLHLTTKEFDLLSLLAQNPGKSFSRQQLLKLVWEYDFAGFEHTVNSHINRLRAKIEQNMADPTFILTTWGFGYRFNEMK
jgi:DNA-binding response OmpR family regulator